MLSEASDGSTGRSARCARWFERLLGAERDDDASRAPQRYMRRLSPLEATYTKERAVEVCMATLSKLGFDLGATTNIKLDLDDRPQKSPRACVIAWDPPRVVHLITRAQGGLHDYQAFLHEAGHALHYAGVDPSLPYAFRRLSRDHALTEIYSYILEAISREPGWHPAISDLDDETARERGGDDFLEALLFRRYVAKLRFELDFWSRFDEVGARPTATRRASPPRPGSATTATPTSRTWTPGSTRPTTCAPGPLGAAPPYLSERSARTGGATRRPASACANSSSRGRGHRARRSPHRIGFDPLDTGPLLHDSGVEGAPD